MSDQAQPAAPAAAPTTEQLILDALNDALPIASTIVGILLPGSATVAAAAIKIAQGVVAGVPEAQKLWEQFQTGTPPTQAELDAYAATELTAYDTVMADIRAKLGTAS